MINDVGLIGALVAVPEDTPANATLVTAAADAAVVVAATAVVGATALGVTVIVLRTSSTVMMYKIPFETVLITFCVV
jgi:hypothetical protein